jgi:sodium transport system permease protein
MNRIWTIVRKELARVFTDKRVVISLFIVPPLMIYLIYGLMGMSASRETDKINEYIPSITILNSPDSIGSTNSFKSYLESLGINGNFQYDANEPIDTLQEKLINKEIDLIIVFPEEFETIVSDNEVAAPKVEIHFNINSSYSTTAYNNYINVLSNYKEVLLGNRFDPQQLVVFTLNPIQNGNVDKATGQGLAMLLPMLIIIFLMAGAMSVGMESIAGEKERGTIATLLVTPIKRSELALGKIISISIISVISTLSSFIGLAAVLPTFTKIDGEGTGLGAINYQVGDYVMILLLMLVSVLFFVAAIVIVSTYAKSVKEAGTLIMPLYIIVMGAAMFNMFGESVPQNALAYIIPVNNVILMLKGIFSFEASITNWLATVTSMFIYTIVMILLVQKMFRNEKIMFNKS